PKPWSIYIPVKVSVYSPAVIVINPVRRGASITATDVELKKVDISLVRGKPFKQLDLVIGSKSKNTLNPGSIIDMNSVCVVCKGDNVLITASNTAISVKMSGMALSDGSIGDSIRVQNRSSKRVIEAVVVNQDTVKAGI
ncbi:MAG: flagellar basal body P-ring formation protein FlgA, partial [Gammaproteobacteria bacterium]|nr:flagellar basal body P-ring formation protein FlgA [Gammaproteobacteria bacterium]NNJ72102.1 flagellar basal body P-ring formation protein FlgA [Enterobacterales bacterium]